VLGYGKDYDILYDGETHTVDLSKLENRKIDEKLFKGGVNEFEFILPTTNTKITFQLLTGILEKKIDAELKGLKKINKNASPEVSTRLKHIILSVDGETTPKNIREFVDNYFLAKDARALREYIVKIQPDIELLTEIENDSGEMISIDIPISLNFFFPDA
jgi:predicted PilT family ATPase